MVRRGVFAEENRGERAQASGGRVVAAGGLGDGPRAVVSGQASPDDDAGAPHVDEAQAQVNAHAAAQAHLTRMQLGTL